MIFPPWFKIIPPLTEVRTHSRNMIMADVHEAEIIQNNISHSVFLRTIIPGDAWLKKKSNNLGNYTLSLFDTMPTRRLKVLRILQERNLSQGI